MTKSNSSSDPCEEHDVEVVLFDLDGTLIDTLDLILASMRHATAAVLGEALPDEELMRNVGVPLANQMSEWAPDRVDEMVAVYREHNRIVHDELVREFPGVDEALGRLCSAGVRMGIVTSKSLPVAQRGIDLFALGGYFETLVAMEDSSEHKPLPEPLLVAAKRMGVEPSACAYVGDSRHDMAAARAAGMKPVAATWGVATEETLLAESPAHVVHSMLEVADLFACGAQP